MRSSSALTALLALLALLACSTRDVETKPFRITATRSSTGASLLDSFPQGGRFSGTGRVVDASTLVVVGTTLVAGQPPEEVTITFDRSAATDVAFPQRLDGVPLSVRASGNATFTGPVGEPLPFYELLVATGTAPNLQHELVLVERTYPTANETSTLPVPLDAADDIPYFTADSDFAQFEPAECGPVFYDIVQVEGDNDLLTLRSREQTSVGILPRVLPQPPERPPWNVLHVLSWHRDGACAGQANAWTQAAAWR